jgi:YidC/Oxa1 family membrane protein insertase
MFVDANIFQPLISVFASVIRFFHDSVGLSWGWSIVLLTICVRMVMIPLTIKQFHSMRRLQMHQPEMKAIQQRYKEDKQRQQQEMMKFYKENNVNPLASCLPMVLQLPVFISLFYMLRKNLRTYICKGTQTAFQKTYAVSYAAHNHVTQKVAALAAASQTTYCTNPTYAHGHAVPGAGFLFIHDITNEAHGATLILLLILYVGTQAVSTLIMSAPTMDKTQRQMMMLMPLLFVLFIIRFPAGLLVYWITTNGWTMVQQFALKRIIGPPPMANPVMVVEEVREAEQGLLGRIRGLISGPGAAGSGKDGSNGDSARGTSNGNGRPRGANAAPPPPPRKKKKRSGRRR